MQQSNVQGLVFLGLAFMLFGAADTLAKLLTTTFHPVQIVWARQAGLVLVAVVLLITRGPGLFRTADPVLQLTRGALAVLSALCFVFAVRYIPLADAVAVTFIAPFMVTVMGAVFLGEHVSRARWVVIVLGFGGSLIIIRPGLGVFHPAIFLVMLAASIFALRQILSRRLAATDNTLTTLTYTAVMSFVLLCFPLPLVWQTPEGGETYLMMAAMGLLAAAAEVMVIRAFQVAEAVVVAPMHYTLIIWATLFGWFVFAQLPDFWTWLGTAIIVLTGLYLVRIDRRVVKVRGTIS